MKKQKNDKKPAESHTDKKPGDQFAYPPGEDIYNNAEEVTNMDVDDITQRKAPNIPQGEMNEKGFEEDMTGNDLDVPGAELDDAAERNGSEDEENNSYSLGGDKHGN